MLLSVHRNTNPDHCTREKLFEKLGEGGLSNPGFAPCPRGSSSSIIVVAFGQDLLFTAQSANNLGDAVTTSSTVWDSAHSQLLQDFFADFQPCQ